MIKKISYVTMPRSSPIWLACFFCKIKSQKTYFFVLIRGTQGWIINFVILMCLILETCEVKGNNYYAIRIEMHYLADLESCKAKWNNYNQNSIGVMLLCLVHFIFYYTIMINKALKFAYGSWKLTIDCISTRQSGLTTIDITLWLSYFALLDTNFLIIKMKRRSYQNDNINGGLRA